MEATKFSVTEIAQMFSDYVERMQNKERHTQAACKEVAAFDLCCDSEFPNNARLQNLMFEKMMNCAVEYEESGFIAGFQTAAALLCGKEDLLHQPAEIPTPETETTFLEPIATPQEEVNLTFISTRKIGEMFDTPNWKVVKRIEDNILPECSEQEKKGFIKCTEKNEQKRDTIVYRLDHQACKLYIQYMSRSTKFFNVAAGIGKLQEMINAVFFESDEMIA